AADLISSDIERITRCWLLIIRDLAGLERVVDHGLEHAVARQRGRIFTLVVLLLRLVAQGDEGLDVPVRRCLTREQYRDQSGKQNQARTEWISDLFDHAPSVGFHLEGVWRLLLGRALAPDVFLVL